MRLPQGATSPEKSRALERRSHPRYPVKLELQCRADGSGEICAGTTTDMSSNGVRFRIDRQISVGVLVELRIAWPTPSPSNHASELVLDGPVLRSDEYGTAIRTRHYALGTIKRTVIRERKTKQPKIAIA